MGYNEKMVKNQFEKLMKKYEEDGCFYDNGFFSSCLVDVELYFHNTEDILDNIDYLKTAIPYAEKQADIMMNNGDATHKIYRRLIADANEYLKKAESLIKKHDRETLDEILSVIDDFDEAFLFC